jgi:AcrR family transcriptional regulator
MGQIVPKGRHRRRGVGTGVVKPIKGSAVKPVRLSSQEDRRGECDPRVERTRAAALAAAKALLDEGGWDAVTHVAVSERSGIGRTTLYRHWPTSDLLLRDLIAAEALSVTGEPSGSLEADLVGHLDTFRRRLQDPAVERHIATVLERATVDPAFARLRAAIISACTRPLATILKAGIARGELTSSLDPAVGVDELAGPILFRHLFVRRHLTRGFVRALVADFMAAHGPARRRLP